MTIQGSDNSFENVIYSLLNGKSATLSDALHDSGFDKYELSIPIGYGLSITVKMPTRIYDICQYEEEKFAIDRFFKYGGAIVLGLEWLTIKLADAFTYFNPEIGIVMFMYIYIEELDKLAQKSDNKLTEKAMSFMQSNENVMFTQAYGNKDFSPLYLMQSRLSDELEDKYNIKLTVVPWMNMVDFFNTWYYSGMLKRGIDYIIRR